MDNNQYYGSHLQASGAPACWAEAKGAEVAKANAMGYPYLGPSGADEATQNYYRQYYSRYYFDPASSNYYPNQAGYNYSYDPKAQASASSASPTGYPPGQDYSAWYQQAGYAYYNGAAYSTSYAYSNPYAYAAQPEPIKVELQPGVLTQASSTNTDANAVAPKTQVSLPLPYQPPSPPPHPSQPARFPSTGALFTSFPYHVCRRNAGSKPAKKSNRDLPYKSGPCEPTVTGGPDKTLPKAIINANAKVTPATTENERLAAALFEETQSAVFRGELTYNPQVSRARRFSQGLRKFFTRIYTKYPSTKDNPEIHKQLVGIVVDAAVRDELWTTNWESYPIPSFVKELGASQPVKKCPLTRASLTRSKKRTRKDTAPRSSDSESDMSATAKNMQEEHVKRKEAEESERLSERIRRFKILNREPSPVPRKVVTPTEQNRADVIDWDDATIIGSCLTHEKSYFRLTSEVNPALVRPLHILQEWAEKLMVKWRETKDYGYILRSVQRIKNPFSVRVYETCARLALESSDLGEFNKCQTKLIEFYSYGIQGNEPEFIAYRILYYLHTRNQSDINKTLTMLTWEQKQHAAISHALQVRSAISSMNYVQFFKLYRVTPNLGKCLINHFLERERIRALIVICTSFRQTIPVAYVASKLGFDTLHDCLAFLKDSDILPNADSLVPNPAGTPITFSTRPVLPRAQAANAKFSKVDLKGQLN
ncbi:hypothetical protein L0F63_005745 [Massospora cicadina]|nr:hypothetical protein L0F63_005745 [Massospora cicadina]